MPDVDDVVARYVLAWSTAEELARLDLLRSVWHPEGRYADDLTQVRGTAALSALIGRFHWDFLPGGHLEVVGGIRSHHRFVTFDWVAVGPTGRTALRGTDLVTLDEHEDVCIQVVGFFTER